MERCSIRDQMRCQLESKDLFEQVKNYTFNYIDSVKSRKVFPLSEEIKGLEIFDESIPELPSDPSNILKMLHEYGSPNTVTQTAGRYFGFVTGGSVPVATAAKWLADVWDQNAAMYVCSPIASKLEEICEKWLTELLMLPNGTVAGFVSGTSNATFCGLAAGRNELLRKLGWDINEKGLFSAPKLRIVLGEQAHASVFKALSLLGIGKENIEKVPVDTQGRIIFDEMPVIDSSTLVIIQAGNVNTGAFDPIDKICNLANSKGAWVHIDGAFGIWAAASESKRYLMHGIEKADSWSVDAHKTLNSPYDCGIILCKKREALIAAMQATGSYLQFSEKRDGMLYTSDMSRRARGVELWATLKFLGRKGLAELVDGLCNLTLQFAQKLQENGFNILNEVVFNQILVSCDTCENTKTTLNNIQNMGECWCGGVTWNEKPAIRISVCSWATTGEDIEKSVQAFIKARNMA